MRILVVSDTHRDAFALREAILKQPTAEVVIHLGDGAEEALAGRCGGSVVGWSAQLRYADFPDDAPAQLVNSLTVYENDFASSIARCHKGSLSEQVSLPGAHGRTNNSQG